MKFTLDRPGTLHVVRGYAPGQLRIGELEYSRSVIVSATTLIDDWRPQHIGELTAADLEPAALCLQREELSAAEFCPAETLFRRLAEGSFVDYSATLMESILAFERARR